MFLLGYLPNSSLLPPKGRRSITSVTAREAKGKSSLRVIKNDGRIDKQNVVYTYPGILALKMKEILTAAIAQIHLEDIIPSETNQTQKD